MLNRSIIGSGTTTRPDQMLSFADLVRFEICKFLRSSGCGNAAIEGFLREVESAKNRDIARDLYDPDMSNDFTVFLAIEKHRGGNHFTILRLQPGNMLSMRHTIGSYFLLNITRTKLEVQKRMIEGMTNGVRSDHRKKN